MNDSAGDGGSSSTAKFTAEQVIAVFRKRADQAKPLTANDVMEALGCSRRTAHDRLDELVERGVLETRKVGARSRIWWVPLPRRNRRDSPAAMPRDPLVEMRIANADLPGSGELLERRRDALRAAYDYLIEHPESDPAPSSTTCSRNTRPATPRPTTGGRPSAPHWRGSRTSR